MPKLTNKEIKEIESIFDCEGFEVSILNESYAVNILCKDEELYKLYLEITSVQKELNLKLKKLSTVMQLKEIETYY